MTNYETTIQDQLKQCRVLFWYDPNGEKRQEFDALYPIGYEKRVVENNEFQIKWETLRDKPERKFLLYFSCAEPAPKDNWLLDIQLANRIFYDDETGMWITELKLDPGMRSLLEQYPGFFKKAAYREKFARRGEGETTLGADLLLRRMSAVILETTGETRDELAEKLLRLFAGGTSGMALKKMEAAGIKDAFLVRLGEDYRLKTPESFDDFALSLFWDEYLSQTGAKAHPNHEAHLLISRWKQNAEDRPRFRKASEKAAAALSIREKLQELPKEKLAKVDLFADAEALRLEGLIAEIPDGTVDPASAEPRSGGPWSDIFGPAGTAVHAAAVFYDELNRADLKLYDYKTGFERYVTKGYRVDQAFRRFMTDHGKQDELPDTLRDGLETLKEKIVKAYQNRWLSRLCESWQKVLETDFSGRGTPFPLQADFFNDFLTKNSTMKDLRQKSAVIISDGLRYEAAAELYARINRDMEGFLASISAMRGVIPSFTQLGMAALLPHRTLELSRNGLVKADGKPTAGIDARNKILQEAVNNALALRADDFLRMSSEEKKKTCSGLKCLVLYHNRIDYEGDHAVSEKNTFGAVDDALDELVKLIRACKNQNFSKILITADHGFLYRDDEVDDTLFPVNDPPKVKADHAETRFMLGDDLDGEPVLQRVPCEDLGYSCETGAYVVRGELRLRKSGSGKRYVHGGATLQETVIPLLRVDVQKKNDVKKVAVSVIESGSRIITTGLKTVRFFQQDPVSEEVMPRTVTAAFYDRDGKPVSDEHVLHFDLEEAEPRLREITQAFTFSGSVQGDVTLRFTEKTGSVTQTTDMGGYTLRRMVETDF